MQINTKYIKGDLTIWIVVILLFMYSILVVYSASSAHAYKYMAGNTMSVLLKHLFIIGTGLAIMYFVHKVNYKFFGPISRIAYIVVIPLLIYTLFKGSDINDASRWIMVPIINTSFQTSDLAKIALMMFLAYLLHKKQDYIKDFKKAFLPIISYVLLICILIVRENFSTAVLLFASSLMLMYIGRIDIKHIALTVFVGLSLLLLTVIIADNVPAVSEYLPRLETWVSRLHNFSGGESSDNYQADLSKMAIANGGVLPSGPSAGVIKNFLPQAFSDFIYAIIIEEYGLILGGFTILLLYLVLFVRVIRVARKCSSPYPAFLSIGLIILLFLQALTNMAVAVNLIPVTGQPLPLVSKGGTSIWFTCAALGVILSVSRSVESEEELNKITSDGK